MNSGERACGPATVQRRDQIQVQRSELSDRLAGVWRGQGREASFFRDLALVRNSDPDLSAFIERTLTGADLRRARSPWAPTDPSPTPSATRCTPCS